MSSGTCTFEAMIDVAGIAEEARRLVEPLGRRWQHVQAVARTAADVAERTRLDRDVLVSAAWLHDIGYAPELRDTGFHPIDGARYLRRMGVDERVVSLVAHHSFSVSEAELRGQHDVISADFPVWNSAYDDALCYCDMTTGPAGETVSPTRRLAEIEERYGPDHVVTAWVARTRPAILAAVTRTETRMRVSTQ